MRIAKSIFHRIKKMTFWEGLRLIDVKVLIFVQNAKKLCFTIFKNNIKLIFFLIKKRIKLFTFNKMVEIKLSFCFIN